MHRNSQDYSPLNLHYVTVNHIINVISIKIGSFKKMLVSFWYNGWRRTSRKPDQEKQMHNFEVILGNTCIFLEFKKKCFFVHLSCSFVAFNFICHIWVQSYGSQLFLSNLFFLFFFLQCGYWRVNGEEKECVICHEHCWDWWLDKERLRWLWGNLCWRWRGPEIWW